MIKVAYGSIPKDGGTFTFYRNQRPALKKLGYDLICVSVGNHEASLVNDKFVDEGCVILAATEKDIKRQSKIFVDWCVKENISVVIGANSIAILSSIPYLPLGVSVVSRCPSIFDDAITNNTLNENRIGAFIALTPRIKILLEKKILESNKNKIRIIPNGIDLTLYEEKQTKVDLKTIQLVWLGRVEHNTKGVFHLIPLVEKLVSANVEFYLTIIGKGIDEVKLRKQLNDINPSNFTFTGELDSRGVIQALNNKDIFLFTSHFEGCPNALLESMAAGCVPVSWRLEGITDFIIDDKKTGFLHMMNNYNGMASSIEKLYHDPSLLSKMAQAVAKVARERFSNEVCAREYAKIFDTVLQEQKIIPTPLSWDFFKPVQAEKSKYPFIPKGIKRGIRSLLSRF